MTNIFLGYAILGLYLSRDWLMAHGVIWVDSLMGFLGIIILGRLAIFFGDGHIRAFESIGWQPLPGPAKTRPMVYLLTGLAFLVLVFTIFK